MLGLAGTHAFVSLSSLIAQFSSLRPARALSFINSSRLLFHHKPLTRQSTSGFSRFAMGATAEDLLQAEVDPSVFDAIVAGTIPSKKVYEDDLILAFHDINPVAPTHILVIPKKRDGLSRLSRATEEHAHILGHMMVKVAQIVRENNIGDFRLVVNNGPRACQEVYHLHLHIIGGRQLKWPPG